ncbi:N-acetylmuramoyl-L-alanine amidase [Bradyrhizobium japonicum]
MASRAKQRVLLGWVLLCAAALPYADSSRLSAAESQPQPSVAVANFPIASAARLAGDGKQTRFILDIDRTVSFRAVTLADPYRVVVDVPQVNFQLPAGTGSGGRGLVKAFRYGLVMPGGSRIVFDLTGPAKIANSYVLEAANGQPARLVLELEEVDRAAFVQSLAPENRPELRPAIADAPPATVPATAGPETAQQKADGRPIVVIDPGHGGIDNGTQSSGESEKNLVLAFGLALRDRLEKGRQIPCRDDAQRRHIHPAQ